MAGRIIAACRAVEASCAWFGRAAGWLVIVLMILVCLTVAAAQLQINTFASWQGAIPVFGEQISVNGVVDLQWYLFAILVMLGGAFTLTSDGHVRVDVLAVSFSPRLRALVGIAGDLLLLLPFAVIMVWFSTRFALSAFQSGEGSSYGGLLDRWVVKAFLPLGFGLLVLSALARALRTLAGLATGQDPD